MCSCAIALVDDMIGLTEPGTFELDSDSTNGETRILISVCELMSVNT